MARTLKDIKLQITTAFVTNETIASIYGLDSNKLFEEQFSKVSFESILFDIVATSIYLLEQLFVKHKEEVSEAIKNQRRGTLPWYRYMALQYQAEDSLIEDSDQYDNTGLTAEQIEQKKIIKYAAVSESELDGSIIVKIAGEEGSDEEKELVQIDPLEVEGVESYFEEIKWAGTRVRVINNPADILDVDITIYRDPLIILEDGTNKSSGKKTVEIALQEFMKELPFDGELVLQSMVDKLQTLDGVKIVHLGPIQSKSWEPEIGNEDGYNDFTGFSIRKLPESGYFKIDNFDKIKYDVV